MTRLAPAKQSREPKMPLSPKVHVLSELVSALLRVGAYYEAMGILEKYPELCKLSWEISEALCRILNYIVDPVFSQIRSVWAEKIDPSPNKSATSTTELIVFPGEQYFYPQWSENIKQAQSFDEVLEMIWKPLSMLGARLAVDQVLFSKLCRMVCAFAKTKEAFKDWLKVVRRCFLPALTMFEISQGMRPSMHRSW